MIQRIQSVYLFLAAILMALPFFPPFPTWKWIVAGMGDTAICNSGPIANGVNLSVPVWCEIALCLTALGSVIFFLWALFSFRHLKAQLQRTLLGNLCVVLYCVALGFEIAGAPYGSQQTGAIRIQIALIFPAVALVLAILAFRGIRRDLRLLRSADRIR